MVEDIHKEVICILSVALLRACLQTTLPLLKHERFLTPSYFPNQREQLKRMLSAREMETTATETMKAQLQSHLVSV